MKYKIGIIGGSGYIGSSLSRYLINLYKIKIIDLKKPPDDLNDNVDYSYCDIRNLEEIKENLKDVDFVIHTAIIQIPLINDQKKLGYEVNVIGTQNVCRAVDENQNIKGMILTGTWHTIGEREISGTIDEEFGFRPDKVEDRARLYALSKMMQESILRFYDEMSDKIYGIIRLGTVLGKGMPETTAANLFIDHGLKGESITPYKHSIYRPMLYVDISDVCIAFKTYIKKILDNKITINRNSLSHIVNIYYPKPITILELAQYIRDSIVEMTNGRVRPEIEIVDKGMPLLFTENDIKNIKINIDKVKSFLEIDQLTNPKDSIKAIIRSKIL